MMNNISKQTIQNWHISYDPYTDIFQMFDKKALKMGRNHFRKINLKSASIYADSNDTPHLVEFMNAYSKIGDIDNMDKISIINKVTGYISNHGR